MPVILGEIDSPIGAPLLVEPLVPPSSAYSSLEIVANHIVGAAASPFTGSQQYYEWPGAFWTAKGNFPPMARETAAEWQAFFIACRGRSKTFVLGDPLAKQPRGSALGVEDVTLAPGAALGARRLATWGWVPWEPTLLAKMDYFQIPRNYLQNPSSFDGVGWDTGASWAPTVTPDMVLGPDGSASADRIVFPAAPSALEQIFFNAPAAVAGKTFTFSVWLKVSSGSTTVRLSLQDRFPISPPDYDSTDLDAAVTTDWQRFSVERTMRQRIDECSALITNFADSAAKTVYAWGAAVYSKTQDAHLYASLTDLQSDGDRNATLDFFPPLRLAGVDIEGCPLLVSNPVGLFRLSKNDIGWVEDTDKHWRDMSFEAVEVL